MTLLDLLPLEAHATVAALLVELDAFDTLYALSGACTEAEAALCYAAAFQENLMPDWRVALAHYVGTPTYGAIVASGCVTREMMTRFAASVQLATPMLNYGAERPPDETVFALIPRNNKDYSLCLVAFVSSAPDEMPWRLLKKSRNTYTYTMLSRAPHAQDLAFKPL
jgi:hypothetical protein